MPASSTLREKKRRIPMNNFPTTRKHQMEELDEYVWNRYPALARRDVKNLQREKDNNFSSWSLHSAAKTNKLVDIYSKVSAHPNQVYLKMAATVVEPDFDRVMEALSPSNASDYEALEKKISSKMLIDCSHFHSISPPYRRKKLTQDPLQIKTNKKPPPVYPRLNRKWMACSFGSKSTANIVDFQFIEYVAIERQIDDDCGHKSSCTDSLDSYTTAVADQDVGYVFIKSSKSTDYRLPGVRHKKSFRHGKIGGLTMVNKCGGKNEKGQHEITMVLVVDADIIDSTDKIIMAFGKRFKKLIDHINNPSRNSIACAVCFKTFFLLRRRYICTSCFKAICGKCSNTLVYNSVNELHRLCLLCKYSVQQSDNLTILNKTRNDFVKNNGERVLSKTVANNTNFRMASAIDRNECTEDAVITALYELKMKLNGKDPDFIFVAHSPSHCAKTICCSISKKLPGTVLQMTCFTDNIFNERLTVRHCAAIGLCGIYDPSGYYIKRTLKYNYNMRKKALFLLGEIKHNFTSKYGGNICPDFLWFSCAEGHFEEFNRTLIDIQMSDLFYCKCILLGNSIVFPESAGNDDKLDSELSIVAGFASVNIAYSAFDLNLFDEGPKTLLKTSTSFSDLLEAGISDHRADPYAAMSIGHFLKSTNSAVSVKSHICSDEKNECDEKVNIISSQFTKIIHNSTFNSADIHGSVVFLDSSITIENKYNAMASNRILAKLKKKCGGEMVFSTSFQTRRQAEIKKSRSFYSEFRSKKSVSYLVFSSKTKSVYNKLYTK